MPTVAKCSAAHLLCLSTLTLRHQPRLSLQPIANSCKLTLVEHLGVLGFRSKTINLNPKLGGF